MACKVNNIGQHIILGQDLPKFEQAVLLVIQCTEIRFEAPHEDI